MTTSDIPDARTLAHKLYGRCRDSPSAYKLLTTSLRKLRNILEEAEELYEENRTLGPNDQRLLEHVRESSRILIALHLALERDRRFEYKDVDENAVSDYKTVLDVVTSGMTNALDSITAGEFRLKMGTNTQEKFSPASQSSSAPLQSTSTGFSDGGPQSSKSSAPDSLDPGGPTSANDPASGKIAVDLHEEKEVVDFNSPSYLQSSATGKPVRAAFSSPSWKQPFSSPDPLSISLEEATSWILNNEEKQGRSTPRAVLNSHASPASSSNTDSTSRITIASIPEDEEEATEILLAASRPPTAASPKPSRPAQPLQSFGLGISAERAREANELREKHNAKQEQEYETALLADQPKKDTTPPAALIETAPSPSPPPRPTQSPQNNHHNIATSTVPWVNVIAPIEETQALKRKSVPLSPGPIEELQSLMNTAFAAEYSKPGDLSAASSASNLHSDIDPSVLTKSLPPLPASKEQLWRVNPDYRVVNATAIDVSDSEEDLYGDSRPSSQNKMRPLEINPLAGTFTSPSSPGTSVSGVTSAEDKPSRAPSSVSNFSALASLPSRAAGMATITWNGTQPINTNMPADARHPISPTRKLSPSVTTPPASPPRPLARQNRIEKPTSPRARAARLHQPGQVDASKREHSLRSSASWKRAFRPSQRGRATHAKEDGPGGAARNKTSISPIAERKSISPVAERTSLSPEVEKSRRTSQPALSLTQNPVASPRPSTSAFVGSLNDRDLRGFFGNDDVNSELQRITQCIHFWRQSSWEEAEICLTAYSNLIAQTGDRAMIRRMRHLMGICASMRGDLEAAITHFHAVLQAPITDLAHLDAGDCAAAYWLGDAYALMNMRTEAILAYCIAERSALFDNPSEPDLIECITAEKDAVRLGASQQDFKKRWLEEMTRRSGPREPSILDSHLVSPAAASALLDTDHLPSHSARPQKFRLDQSTSRAKLLQSLRMNNTTSIPETTQISSHDFDPRSPWPLPYDPYFCMANVQRGRLLAYSCDLLRVFATDSDTKLMSSGPKGLSRMVDCCTSNDLPWLVGIIRQCLETFGMEWTEIANALGTWFVVRYSFADNRISTWHYFSIAMFRQSLRGGYGAEICPEGIWSARIMRRSQPYEKGVAVTQIKQVKTKIREFINDAAKRRPKAKRNISLSSLPMIGKKVSPVPVIQETAT